MGPILSLLQVVVGILDGPWADGQDGEYFVNQFGKDRGLVTGTGANLQDAVPMLKFNASEMKATT